MTRTTVAVSTETHERLFDRKGGPGRSYDSVITELLDETDGADESPAEVTAQ